MPEEPNRSEKTPFRALQQRRAFEEIILQIEQAIVDGRLGQGDRLPGERELAETFGVSRSSVREALRALEMFGVVVARRGTGADAGSTVAAGARPGLVSALRLHSALLRIPTDDFVDLRALVEGHAASRAALRPGADRTRPLRELIERMRGAAGPADFHHLDTSFHVTLAEVSGNALILLLMGALRELMEREMLRLMNRVADWPAERDRLISEHELIVERVEAADADAAAAAVRHHIFRFYREAVASAGLAAADGDAA